MSLVCKMPRMERDRLYGADALLAVDHHTEGMTLATQQAQLCRSYCQPSFSPEGEASLVSLFPHYLIIHVIPLTQRKEGNLFN